MTPAVADAEDLRDLLARTRALLLDFDGPVCSVFAGIPATVVANQLRAVLTDGGHQDLPPEIETSADPFDVLRYAATLSAEDARDVEAAFRAHEAEAITTAAETPGAHDLIRTWHEVGRPLAIVSNNSTTSVEAYLDLYDLRRYVTCVSARADHDVTRLKPNPFLLRQAVATIGVPAGTATLVGDSVTDVEAAHAAGSLSIGYANKPGKQAILTAASADLVITSMTELVERVGQA